jgi:hypothetical protein
LNLSLKNVTENAEQMIVSNRIRLLMIFALTGALLGAYVLSICWRVSLEELNQFGRSDLLPVSAHAKKYSDPPTADTFGDGCYTFISNGKSIVVYKQLTNGFQHAYGSALASYEVGSTAADLLFRANEYAESLFARNSGTDRFYEDTKKDLGNNALGRQVGDRARVMGLTGKPANEFILKTITEMVYQKEVFIHWQDPRVKSLPSPEQFGCPCLTRIQKARRALGSITYSSTNNFSRSSA